MSVFAFARRGACVSVSILALGLSPAFAQQASSDTNSETQQAPPPASDAAKDGSTVNSTDPAPANAETAPPPGTSNLPELVVDGPNKKDKKKTAKAKEQVSPTPTASDTTTEESAAPTVTYGTGAASDTGTTTFDANAVQMRTNGSGDANTFIRNLPNVQYQKQSNQDAGVTSTKLVDTKPELMSISGGRTYENNFIINGVSTTNITGVATQGAELTASGTPGALDLFGLSPQTQFVPTEFVGQATIIDSNASAEYGQFVGGVVVYDLQGPPTDRYRASVNFSRDSSDYANFLVATKDGTNRQNKVAPTYEKTNLSASVGAPITRDFAFIAQASRREAESTKPTGISVAVPQVAEWSDNVFLRFAATARTDIGKFTFDVSRTDYFQHFVDMYSDPNSFYDSQTQTTSTQLKYETDLTGIRSDDVGLGRVKLKASAFHNNSETANNGNSATGIRYQFERFSNYVPGQGWTNQLFGIKDIPDWCKHADPATLPQNVTQTSFLCADRAYGDLVQGQKDFGVQANVTGDLLLGTFKLGGEVKQYEGRKARLSEYKSVLTTYALNDATNTVYNTVPGVATGGAGNSTFTKFTCATDGICGDDWLASTYTSYKTYDVTKTLDAMHAYAEIDQTLAWFNVRAGARLDYDDYFKNLNLAPRLSGTVKPIDGLSFSAGYNRYYLGETLYYALRDGISGQTTYTRQLVNGLYWNSDGVANQFVEATSPVAYKFNQLDTPYNDEYTGAVGVKDPFLGGQLRLRYLQRYGRDEFSTALNGVTYQVGNNGESTYRSASAEYGKSWDNLRNPFFLNAAAINGNVTWSKQWKSQDNYLLSADIDGNGSDDASRKVYYDGNVYDPLQFAVITGNLDIPVRFGATLATVWFNDVLELNLNAGINLGYEGVYNAGTYTNAAIGCSPSCNKYDPWSYKTALKLDLSGRVNVNEYAAIDFHVDNITNSTQSYVATYDNPWVLGRSFWIGSTLKLQ